MTDLRKAAEMALEGFKIIHKGCGAVKEEAQFRDDKDVRDLATEIRKICNKYSKSLRQALAQPEQEPVVGMFEEKLPDQNPPPWSRSYRLKREWVGLTDEELKPLCHEWQIIYGGYVRPFAETIEAKLKEKNT